MFNRDIPAIDYARCMLDVQRKTIDKLREMNKTLAETVEAQNDMIEEFLVRQQVLFAQYEDIKAELAVK